MKNFFTTIFLIFIGLIVIGFIFDDTEKKNLEKVDMLKTAKIDKISPSGNLYEIYSLGSNYTDLQRENTTKELKDKILSIVNLSEQERKNLGINGKKWIYENRQYSNLAKQYINKIQELRFFKNA